MSIDPENRSDTPTESIMQSKGPRVVVERVSQECKGKTLVKLDVSGLPEARSSTRFGASDDLASPMRTLMPLNRSPL